MKIIIVGIQGAGKSTQGNLIKEKLGLANANELVTAAARWVASNA